MARLISARFSPAFEFQVWPTLIKGINIHRKARPKHCSLVPYSKERFHFDYGCALIFFSDWMTVGLLTWLVVHFTFNVVVTDSSWRTIHLAFLCQKQHIFADIWGRDSQHITNSPSQSDNPVSSSSRVSGRMADKVLGLVPWDLMGNSTNELQFFNIYLLFIWLLVVCVCVCVVLCLYV